MKSRLAACLLALSALVVAPAAHAAELSKLDILVPSGVGGGWDQTGRALQQALRTEKLSSNIQVTNVPGAGGTIGLSQFVTTKNGRPAANGAQRTGGTVNELSRAVATPVLRS